MNQQKIAILIDSGTDVPAALIAQYHMYSVPLKIIYQTEEYADGIDITASEVYRRLPEEIPKTSLPDGESILQTFDRIKADGYKKVLVVTISSGLSGTFNMIQLLAQEYHGLDFFCLNTKNISIGSGFFAIYAAQLLQTGTDWDTLKTKLSSGLGKSKVFFCLETLEYLKKGGRIGAVTAALGTALNLKPIISCNTDGVYYTMAKVRGRRQSIEKILELSQEYAQGAARYNIALIASGESALKEAAEIRDIVLAQFPNRNLVIEGELGSCLGVHVGPGLLGIGVHILDETTSE